MWQFPTRFPLFHMPHVRRFRLTSRSLSLIAEGRRGAASERQPDDGHAGRGAHGKQSGGEHGNADIEKKLLDRARRSGHRGCGSRARGMRAERRTRDEGRGWHGRGRIGGRRRSGRIRAHPGRVREPAGLRLPPEHDRFLHAVLAGEDRLHRVEPPHDQVGGGVGHLPGRTHRRVLPVLREPREGRRRAHLGRRRARIARHRGDRRRGRRELLHAPRGRMRQARRLARAAVGALRTRRGRALRRRDRRRRGHRREPRADHPALRLQGARDQRRRLRT